MKKYSFYLLLLFGQVFLGSQQGRNIIEQMGIDLKNRSMIVGDDIELIERCASQDRAVVCVKKLPFIMVEIQKNELWHDGVNDFYIGSEAYKAVEKAMLKKINIKENHGFFTLLVWFVASQDDVSRFGGEIIIK